MTKEQVENSEVAQETAQADADGTSSKRERSTIQFPYNDLDDAVRIAKAVHENAGVQCTLDQLAAYVKQPITSGGFRVSVSTAAMFGLTENERGVVRLTELGRHIANPAKEEEAHAEAFLRVPLYAHLYENYKGFTIPPPAALEKFIQEAGVVSKQTDRARRAFMRSARQAGFFAHGEDRLVRPSAGRGPGTKPIEDVKPTADAKPKGGSGGGNGPDFSALHPFIQGLLKTLPEPESDWPVDARAKWLQTAASIFDLIYQGEGGIKVEVELPSRLGESDQGDHHGR